MQTVLLKVYSQDSKVAEAKMRANEGILNYSQHITAQRSSCNLDSHSCSQYSLIFIKSLDKPYVPELSSPFADTANFLHGGLTESLNH